MKIIMALQDNALTERPQFVHLDVLNACFSVWGFGKLCAEINWANIYLSTDTIGDEIMKATVDHVSNFNIETKSDQLTLLDFAQYFGAVEGILGNVFNDFKSFSSKVSAGDETYSFWNDFDHGTCFSFMGFYLALRSSDWDLHNYFLKYIGALFLIVPSSLYYRLIPTANFPSYTIENFKQRGFTASVAGNSWSSLHLTKHTKWPLTGSLKV